MSNLDSLENLTGMRLRIFCYLLQNPDKEFGVREVMRAMNLKTSSHSSYHLQKLNEMGILIKTPQNTYLFKEEFKQKSVKLNVLTEFILIRGKFLPKSIFFATYLFVSFIFGIILLSVGKSSVITIYFYLSLIVSSIVVVFDIKRQFNVFEDLDNGS